MAKKKKNQRVRPENSLADRLGGAGMGAGIGGQAGGMGNIMSQMNKMQEQMAQTQEELADEMVEVSVGGGVVTVVANGNQEIQSIKIQPDVVDPEDVEMLEDLILSAVTEALQKSSDLAEERMGGLTSGLGLPPGLGL